MECREGTYCSLEIPVIIIISKYYAPRENIIEILSFPSCIVFWYECTRIELHRAINPSNTKPKITHVEVYGKCISYRNQILSDGQKASILGVRKITWAKLGFLFRISFKF